MKEIEIEYRVEIPTDVFDYMCSKINSIADLKSHKSRFSLMAFLSKGDIKSVLYLRATIDQLADKVDTEIVHKKGAQHAHDRTEITQKISLADFENFLRIFSTITSDKTLVMEREIVNFNHGDGIVVSLVKSKKHSYIEFEKLSDELDKERSSEKILNLISLLGMVPLDKVSSEKLFKDLDM